MHTQNAYISLTILSLCLQNIYRFKIEKLLNQVKKYQERKHFPAEKMREKQYTSSLHNINNISIQNYFPSIPRQLASEIYIFQSIP